MDVFQFREKLVADYAEFTRRVREASAATGTYQVSPSLPVDVMGVYILIPAA
jgi:hypothetical protein